MKVNLARLNHILIPTQAADRDRWRNTRLGRALKPFGLLYEALTREGQLVTVLSVLTGAVSLDVQGFDGHLFWAPLTAVQLCSLLAARAYTMPDVTLDVALPPRVVAGEDVQFTVTLRNGSAREHHAVRVYGPFLTWDGRWTSEDTGLSVLPARGHATVALTARFSSRGEHHLDRFRAGAMVPFGLALGPSVQGTGCRFVVVPRVARVERVETPLGQRHQPGGVARVQHHGPSMDLRGVRPYRAGDNVRDLHARSWARTGAPVVREFQQEYFRRVAVLLDTDGRDVEPETFEAAVSLTAGLVSSLSREDALVDLLVLGQRAHDLTPGRGSLDATLDLLACVEPDDRFDPDAVGAVLGPFAPRLSSAVVVSCRWDAERDALLDRVRAYGVGARGFVVHADARAAEYTDARATTVPAGTILRGERLVL